MHILIKINYFFQRNKKYLRLFTTQDSVKQKKNPKKL